MIDLIRVYSPRGSLFAAHQHSDESPTKNAKARHSAAGTPQRAQAGGKTRGRGKSSSKRQGGKGQAADPTAANHITITGGDEELEAEADDRLRQSDEQGSRHISRPLSRLALADAQAPTR